MYCLQYEEGAKNWYRPRHPFVAVHDLIVMAVAVVLVLVTSSWHQLYFLVVAGMFAASSLHHWLPYQSWHHRLDRSMIQIMIAGTPLPYTNEVLANGDFVWLVLLWVSAGAFAIVKTLLGYLTHRGFWSAVVYVVTGLLAVVVMLPVESQSAWWAVAFWSGVGMYAVQLLSYNRQWFDFIPERFGYREVQHLILLAAVGLHVLAMTFYASDSSTQRKGPPASNVLAGFFFFVFRCIGELKCCCISSHNEDISRWATTDPGAEPIGSEKVWETFARGRLLRSQRKPEQLL